MGELQRKLDAASLAQASLLGSVSPVCMCVCVCVCECVSYIHTYIHWRAFCQRMLFPRRWRALAL